MEYKIIVDAFEGPMDLLLHLIDKAEIDIYDIPINIIAEQFIEYIQGMEELNLEVTSEFLLMASTLLEIKSKMLLPQEINNSGEQLEMEEVDPRVELIRRIVEYKKYKEAAGELKKSESIYSKMFFKPREELIEYVDDELELKGLSIDMLLKSINKIVKKNEKKIKSLDTNFIQREEYTLEEGIKNIKSKLEDKDILKFSELFNSDISKGEIVIYFLAILELIRSKYINIEQEKDFSELFIIKEG